MFRSPGSASSPDLATLLRKARENGGVVVPGGSSSNSNSAAAAATTPSQDDAGHGLTPGESSGAGFLSPGQSSPRLRGSSSTSSFSMISAVPRTPGKEGTAETSGRPSLTVNGGTDVGTSPAPSKEWSMTSPRARSGSKVRSSLVCVVLGFLWLMLLQSGKSMRSRATNFFGKMLGQDTKDKGVWTLPSSVILTI